MKWNEIMIMKNLTKKYLPTDSLLDVTALLDKARIQGGG